MSTAVQLSCSVGCIVVVGSPSRWSTVATPSTTTATGAHPGALESEGNMTLGAIFLSEVVGTAMLLLLGAGVVANTLLPTRIIHIRMLLDTERAREESFANPAAKRIRVRLRLRVIAFPPDGRVRHDGELALLWWQSRRRGIDRSNTVHAVVFQEQCG